MTRTPREDLPPGIGTKPKRPQGKKGQEAFKRFIYATHLTPEEEELFELLEDADLGHEANLIRIRISRLLGEEAAARIDEDLEHTSLTPKEIAERCFVFEEYSEKKSDEKGLEVTSTRRRKQIDYLLLAYISRLAALEKTRAELNSGGVNAAEDRAQAVMAALQQMKAKRGVVDADTSD